MNQQHKALIISMLDRPDVRVSMTRRVIESDLDAEGYQRVETSKTLYVLIAVGPEDPSVENVIRTTLGHDSFGFLKR